MNYVVIYKNKYGISGFRYMFGMDMDDVRSMFTIQYPDMDITGIYVSATDIRNAMLSFLKTF